MGPALPNCASLGSRENPTVPRKKCCGQPGLNEEACKCHVKRKPVVLFAWDTTVPFRQFASALPIVSVAADSAERIPRFDF